MVYDCNNYAYWRIFDIIKGRNIQGLEEADLDQKSLEWFCSWIKISEMNKVGSFNLIFMYIYNEKLIK